MGELLGRKEAAPVPAVAGHIGEPPHINSVASFLPCVARDGRGAMAFDLVCQNDSSVCVGAAIEHGGSNAKAPAHGRGFNSSGRKSPALVSHNAGYFPECPCPTFPHVALSSKGMPSLSMACTCSYVYCGGGRFAAASAMAINSARRRDVRLATSASFLGDPT